MEDEKKELSPVDGVKNREAENCVHVLLVDNEHFIVKLWKHVLEKQGYKVSSYTNGLLALEEFKTKSDSFDIVITDQSMPEITGYELAVEILKIRKDIKIIICTGYLEDEETAYSKGISEVLIKPFDNNALIQAVKRNIMQ